MTEIRKGGDSNSLSDIDVPQGEFRSQISALTDAVRQLGGNPEIAPGSTTSNDPLSAPYILYVNSYTGSDKFVTGDYSTYDDGTFAAKMRRISNQRLECGYTEARPFKTINRAVIEAAIITSRDYLNLGNYCGDNITIVLASGQHEAINGDGKADTDANFPKWSDNKEPTIEELQSFNPTSNGGIVLPRSCSIVSADLRKTRIAPCFVPAPANEAADLSNRYAIFRMTGGGYYYGFTFVDKILTETVPPKQQTSHHLLTCFEYASKAQLDELYSKIRRSFSGIIGINDDYAVTRNYENQIVGPQPPPGFQGESTDTTRGSSPYIYNISIRSDYGLCGVLLDGNKATGFKSLVIAQYTGVSLQRDMTCWQKYNAGSWSNYTQADYNDYINETPNNVRMDPDRSSFHIRAINRSIVQEVSVFAIGQGIHHFVQSGGELTVTNSNSNFGGCASFADGFVDYSFDTDKNWNVGFIKTAVNIEPLANQYSTYFLGRIKDDKNYNSATTLELEAALTGEENNVPDILDRDGFTLNNYGGTNLLWVENPNGPDYYAPLANTAWSTTKKDEINIKTTFLSAGDDNPPTNDDDNIFPPIAGKRIYVRRLRDTRSLDQRKYSLICNNTAADSRNIVRDYGLQTDTDSAVIDSEIKADEPIIAASVAVLKATGGVQRTNEIELRRAAASDDWDDRGEYRSAYHASNNYYRPGDVVRYQNKHWKCIKEHIAGTAFDATKFDEAFVHTREDYAAEDYFKNAQPVIYFDKDTDETAQDPYLGYSIDALSKDDELKRQLRTATDYLGLFSFLRSLGFNTSQSNNILEPKAEADRLINPNTAYDGIPQPDKAANAWDNWEIQFRRPSNIRLYSHAFEWAGFLNYTKSLPQYQRDLTASNKFSYYFTNSNGGRCYVSGFNEEGFGVSAAGLTDLQTGETLSPEGIGSDARDPNEPTVFNGNVIVNGLLEANEINSNQKSLVRGFKDNANEPSEGRGMSWIAPMENIIDVTDVNEIIDRNTRNENNANGSVPGTNTPGYTGASFVTPYYLDTWRTKNRLLGSLPGPVYIYINPRATRPTGDFPNSTINESSNWNADLEGLINNPPLSPQTACNSIRLAVRYADATLNTATQVVFYCGCGLYTRDAGNILIQHRAQIVGFNFKNNKYADDQDNANNWLGTVNDEKGSGGNLGRFPEGNQLLNAIRNPDNMPIFLTKIYYFIVNSNTQNRISCRPLSFTFKQRATLKAVTWWGVSETLRGMRGDQAASDNTIPNSWFTYKGTDQLSKAQIETIRNQDNDDICNAAFYYLLSGKGDLDYFDCNPIVFCQGPLRTENVCVTAPGFSRTRGGRSDNSALITCDAAAVLELSGLTLVGNNRFSNDTTGLPGVVVPKLGQQSAYEVFGFMPCLISTGASAADAVVSLHFGRYGRSIVEGPSARNYNVTSTNWHLICNNGKYMDNDDAGYATTPTTDKDKMGPGFNSIFGSLMRNRRQLRYHWNEWRANTENRKSGVAGNFGFTKQKINSGDTTGFLVATLSSTKSEGARAVPENGVHPEDEIPQGTFWNYELRPTIFKRNGTSFPAEPDAKTNPAGDDPSIMNEQFKYGSGALALNIKYAEIAYGLDYIRNYQSNARLYG